MIIPDEVVEQIANYLDILKDSDLCLDEYEEIERIYSALVDSLETSSPFVVL